MNNKPDILSMFGLNADQMVLMFSLEKLLIENDINHSKSNVDIKTTWLKEWEESLLVYLDKSTSSKYTDLLNKSEIQESINHLLTNSINNTWYYLIMLELTLFKPYYSLSNDAKQDKIFSKLKYIDQTEYIKKLVNNNVMDVIFIDRFKRTYSKTISRISGKSTKIALAVVGTIAIAAITAATAGALSGPIAVYLLGAQFVGLTGAALTSAALAMLGGGAIAIGGLGMAGGVLVIVGGGALLGLAGGGTVVGAVTMYIVSVPELALTQAAKLEVVLKEIVVNSQKDIISAQTLLQNYKDQISNLSSELTQMKLNLNENKNIIKSMEKSLSYMESAYKNSLIFVSSYEIGKLS